MMFLDRVPVYRALRPQHRRTRESIDEFRDARIRKMIAHSYRNVPFYRSLFDRHGIVPADIRGAADLVRIPITTRREIQDASLTDRLAKGVDPSRLIERSTTGSTGKCLVIRRTWSEEQVLNFFRWRTVRAYGLRLADVIANPRIKVPTHPRDNQIPRRIANALHVYRKVIVDLRFTTDDVGALHDLHPEVILGWPTILAEMAPRWAELNRAKPSRNMVRFVISGGEVLTPAARDQITSGFRAPVRDMYGAHEFSIVASQCPATDEYHLSDETLYAEVIRDDRRVGAGESGEVVVTGLHSFAMPFIRYKLGDVVIQGSPACACGSPFATIRSIRGRAADYLTLPHGGMVHPQDIARDSYRAAPWIKQLQVVQESVDRIRLDVVPLRDPSPDEVAAIRPAVAGLFGRDVSFDVSIVPSIETAQDSKFRVYKSNVTMNSAAVASRSEQ